MILNKRKIHLMRYKKEISDLLENSDVRNMNNFIQHSDITTFIHCTHVSFISYLICLKFGWCYRDTARGALLHDMFLYDWHDKNVDRGKFHGFTHPRTALNNAEKSVCSLNDRQKDIILNHMWPLTIYRLPKYKETYIVTLADKICTSMEVMNIRPYYFRQLDRVIQNAF